MSEKLIALHLTKKSWVFILIQNLLNSFRKGRFSLTTENDVLVDIDMLADVSVPEDLTTENFWGHCWVSQLFGMKGELSDAELLEIVAAWKHQQAEAQEDSASDSAVAAVKAGLNSLSSRHITVKSMTSAWLHADAWGMAVLMLRRVCVSRSVWLQIGHAWLCTMS